MGDDTEGSRWLTYQALADALGIKRETAVRLARKRRWPRRPGNDGTARVAAPREILEARRELKAEPEGDREDALEGDPGAKSDTINALHDHIATLKQQLANAEQRLDVTLADARAAAEERRRLMERISGLEAALDEANERAGRRWWRRWRGRGGR